MRNESDAAFKFFFAKNMILNSEEEKSNLLQITSSILDHFLDLSGLINDKNTAFIVHWMNYLDGPFGNTLGHFFDLSIPWHLSRLKDDLCKLQLPFNNISVFQYIIVLANKIVSSKTNIEKIFTIAHEVQHLSQHVHNKESILKCIVLHRYLCCRKDPRCIYSLPHDLDAIRQAKLVNYQINERQEVDDFINNKIRISSIDSEGKYWSLLKSMDPFSAYDLRNETELMWKEYALEIKNVYLNNSDLKEAYEFFLSATEILK